MNIEKETKSQNEVSASAEEYTTPFSIRILEDEAKSNPVDYDKLPEGVRGFIDSMAMSLLDAHGGKLIVMGYEVVGKSFLIEQLAFNKKRFMDKSSHDNLAFISMSSQDVYSIEQLDGGFREYIEIVTEELGVEERDICFVTTDLDVSAILFEFVNTSKIIFESNINTLKNLIQSELSGNVNIWGSWSSHDANELKVKKKELLSLLMLTTNESIKESFGIQFQGKEVSMLINMILKNLPITVDNEYVYAPPGVFAVCLRRLAGYLAFGSTSNVLNAKGAPSLIKSAKMVIADNESLFERFLPFDENMHYPMEAGLDDLPEELQKMIDSGAVRVVSSVAPIEEEPKTDGKPAFSDITTLADRIKKEVIGQDEAIEKVVVNVSIPAAGLNDPRKPISSIMLLGPTGIGKTKLAETLAKELMDIPMKTIRLDMSEYSQPNEAVKLFGAPSGYIGHEKGGVLTSAVLKNPHSLILLDEVEKAHPIVWDAFLQVFDAGRMTSGKGEEVDFSGTIIMMTSNLGSKEINQNRSGFSPLATVSQTFVSAEKTVLRAVEEFFRPELLNRIDELVMMNSLTEDTARKILLKELEIIFERSKLAGFELETPSDDIIDVLLERADISKYGAREIQRIIKNNLSSGIALAMLQSDQKSMKISFAIDEDNKITVKD